MTGDIRKKILLLVSNSIKEPDLISGDDLLVQSMTELGYDVNVIVFSNIYDLIEKIKASDPDLVFNLFQNTSADISIQMNIVSVLELLRIPYIGHNPFVLGLSNMKNFVKRLLEHKRIPSIPYQIYRQTPNSTYLNFPVILRPVNLDWPTTRIREKQIMEFDTLKSAVSNYLNSYNQPVLVESFFPGRILYVGIFGNLNSKILPVCEAITDKNSFTFECPAKIDRETTTHLRDAALHVYKYLMGKDYALISFLMVKEHEIYVADYHPNPSLLADSIFQLSFRVSNYKFKEFLQLIIDEALNKKQNDKN